MGGEKRPGPGPRLSHALRRFVPSAGHVVPAALARDERLHLAQHLARLRARERRGPRKRGDGAGRRVRRFLRGAEPATPRSARCPHRQAPRQGDRPDAPVGSRGRRQAAGCRSRRVLRARPGRRRRQSKLRPDRPDPLRAHRRPRQPGICDPQGARLRGRLYAPQGHVRDLAPTILALLGAPIPGYLDGKPLIAADERCAAAQ